MGWISFSFRFITAAYFYIFLMGQVNSPFGGPKFLCKRLIISYPFHLWCFGPLSAHYHGFGSLSPNVFFPCICLCLSLSCGKGGRSYRLYSLLQASGFAIPPKYQNRVCLNKFMVERYEVTARPS